MSKKLFVGNLSFEVTDFDLEDLFKQYGEVVSAKVILDRDTSRSRGFGFVEMSSESSAQSSIDALNGTEVKGRAINVSIAKERTDDRGGFRNSGGGGFKKRRNSY
ncbi:MAG: RNA-binding protein [Candidatus Melainabacteria bacterium RIFCSPLOWO2_02_FULL_35_15]|nr:MAG: RNA-binding protein [Candidatus Melainabacteria bacterium RIFCSPLOWO2_12_FULL_35_11]OGI14033.1 MAG: RNA-binding protein [Candidatus Melainabacteria bacterium RIFCSPLOWO2_02_FULL_35_15]